jgi:hypothetical protein
MNKTEDERIKGSIENTKIICRTMITIVGISGIIYLERINMEVFKQDGIVLATVIGTIGAIIGLAWNRKIGIFAKKVDA